MGVSIMDRTHQRDTRDENPISCSACAAVPTLFISLLDSRNGKQHRIFKCDCGEIIWDDKTAYLIGNRSASHRG